MRRFRPLLLAALAALNVIPAANAQRDDPRIDPATGQDQHVWPPDVLFDYQHIRLDITIPDMAKPQFTGRETLRLAPIGAPRSSITLRAGSGLSFASVYLDKRPLDFVHQKEVLTITLPRAMPVGESFTLTIDYSASKPGGSGRGMTFSKDDPGTPEFDPMLHTQGQPEDNHLWFPIHDFPNMRLTSEVVATVPEGFQAVSNGRLLSTRLKPGQGDSPGTATYHWLQDKPHASYLIVLCVGKFDVVNVGGKGSARPGLWLPVYGPLGSAEVLRRNFGNTADMVAYFEKLFDEPFPWDKYANVLCRNFSAGAMENSSCTTFQQSLGLTRGAEGVNAHELCHQWFGDLVGYKGWEHTWLGEGWATFGEALWAESKRGKRGYANAILTNARATRSFADHRLPEHGGMVSILYTNPNQRFFSPYDSVYQKGGWFLHSLRCRLGDDTFFAGVRLYLHRNRMHQVETDDFRHALEEVSGQSLERYFQQFASRPGLPKIRVDLSWDEEARTLGATVEQTQRIDADNPAFALSIPVLIDLGENQSQEVFLDTDAKTATASFRLPHKPTKVVVDPDLTVLADAKIRHPLDEEVSWWTDQLRTGPTEFARIQAAEHLADIGRAGNAGASRALAAVALATDAEPSTRELAGTSLVWAVFSTTVPEPARTVAASDPR